MSAMIKKYGELPKNLGIFPIEVKESMFYLYMPIKLHKSSELPVYEHRLQLFAELINTVVDDLMEKNEYYENAIYITAKHMFITPSFLGNRPGYHSDGFMSDDINYIWCDANPTTFNNSKFNITQHDEISLDEMEAQALVENEVRYPIHSFLRLDQFNIHKVSSNNKTMMRTFVKISVSKDKYNLIGNSHNYELDYEWEMFERKDVRNIPQIK